jgi:hypothetical protein
MPHIYQAFGLTLQGNRSIPGLSEAVDTVPRATLDPAARDSEGLWLDFESVMGGSNDWVSAYTGTILAELPASGAHQAAQQTWDILSRRLAASGGWSYNPRLPADADATVWAVRLARALGLQDSEPARRAAEYLVGRQHPGGWWERLLVERSGVRNRAGSRRTAVIDLAAGRRRGVGHPLRARHEWFAR